MLTFTIVLSSMCFFHFLLFVHDVKLYKFHSIFCLVFVVPVTNIVLLYLFGLSVDILLNLKTFY